MMSMKILPPGICEGCGDKFEPRKKSENTHCKRCEMRNEINGLGTNILQSLERLWELSSDVLADAITMKRERDKR